MIDLTADEQARVRVALQCLRARSGGWKPLAKALGFSKYTVIHVKNGEKNVSPTMAFRVARLAAVPVDELLAGVFPPPGTCRHCGKLGGIGL